MMEPREEVIARLGVRNEEGTSDKTMASKYISGKDFRLHEGFERILSETGVK